MSTTNQNIRINPNIEILYKDLSYQIIGVTFKVFNDLGYGFQEKYYHRALAEDFTEQKIPFRQEVYIPIRYKGKIIGRYHIDFVVDNKIALEIKVGNEFYPRDWRQLAAYLKAANIELGILILITREGVQYKRILNNTKKSGTTNP